ncbi:VOC family protein [Microbaculum marinum]|uniref:VOC family protein n=1 Tax=Microbaculum marinum TaxID=1764581 RepID=A0AAW9RMQ9_9HYPH
MANKFVWYELMTSDPAAAKSFYGDVVGWTAKDMEHAGIPGIDYTVLSANGEMVAGLMEMPDAPKEAGAGPFWVGYVGVDDVDAMAQKVAAAGGAIHRAPEDIPDIGRFAVVADPHGAVFCLLTMSGSEGGGSGAGISPMTAGHVGWRELMAGDLGTEFAFYSGLFGWEKGQAIDMGAMGTYQLFDVDGLSIGGMMTKPAELAAPPHWGYYFTVPKIEAAVDLVKSGGGAVLNGPMEVPGGAWIINCTDPQGAYFSLVAPPTSS